MFSKKELARYTLEAVLIVFSVLLALFLDQALEDRRESRAMDELMGHIVDEMESNQAIVNTWLPYHRDVVANINRHLASEELLESLLTENGINYAVLMEKGTIQEFYSVSSWQLAQQSQIMSSVDFDITRAISNAYYSQLNVNRTLERISDFFFSREMLDNEQFTNSITILRNLMGEVAGQEYVLQENYRIALEQAERFQ